MSDDSEAWKGEPEGEIEWPSFLRFMHKLTPEEQAARERERAEFAERAAAAALALPAFRLDRPCVKCGHGREADERPAKVRHCRGTESTGYVAVCTPLAGTGEHFHRICPRCKFVWYEAVLSGEAHA